MGRDYVADPMGARIKVVGVGGGGGNAINNMMAAGLCGVDFIVANTDSQALYSSAAPIKIQLGIELTKGLGAGADPDIGGQAAVESIDDIREALMGADMVFITAGMGGGTGTGAASVIASVARELGALTVAVVTKPFSFEGSRRMKSAAHGIAALEKEVDTLVTVPNDKLHKYYKNSLTLMDAFRRVDDVLLQAIKGVSDLILYEGLVNVDFADVKAVMSGMGIALMGSGYSEAENRAVDAAEKAISSPLLDDVSIQGARGVLINITASSDVTLEEVTEAAELIQREAHPDANVIWGMAIDDSLGGGVRVTVIATGFIEGKQDLAAANSQEFAPRAGSGRFSTPVEGPKTPLPFFPLGPKRPSEGVTTTFEPKISRRDEGTARDPKTPGHHGPNDLPDFLKPQRGDR